MAARVKGMRDYLGDGVYVDLDIMGNTILTTEDGTGIQNTIVMDSAVLEAFELWQKRAEQVLAGVRKVR